MMEHRAEGKEKESVLELEHPKQEAVNTHGFQGHAYTSGFLVVVKLPYDEFLCNTGRYTTTII